MASELFFYFIIVCGFAAFVHGSIGFGFPMLSTPLLALATDVQTAILLTLVPNIFVNVSSIKSEGHFFQALQTHYKLVLLTAVGSLLGTLILLNFESEFYRAILAAVILLYLASDSFNVRLKWIRDFPRLSKISFGLTSGMLGGLTNVMAATLLIYSLETDQSKKDIIQSTNMCFLFGKIVQILLFAVNAKFTPQNTSASLWVVFAVLVFLPLGFKLKSYISEKGYKKLIKALLFCIAIALLGQLFPMLWG